MTTPFASATRHGPATPGPMTPALATVEDVTTELADTVTLHLAPPLSPISSSSATGNTHPGGGRRGPDPGQFAMLWVPGVGEIPISYSGIGADGRAAHTVKAVGATSQALTRLRPGSQVGVRGPFGRGWDLTDLGGGDLLVVAGGLGLAPLRPIFDEAANGRLDARAIRAIVGARSPSGLLWRSDVPARWPDIEIQLTVDRVEPGWRGFIGPVTSLLDGMVGDLAATTALVCGPEVMMYVVGGRLAAMGLPSERIQVSLERTMHCGIGLCGHCQLGPLLTCLDGPVVEWTTARELLAVRER